MSVYSGYIWELKKKYLNYDNRYSVLSIQWFDSKIYSNIHNDYGSIFIMEPIKNVTDKNREYIKSNLHLLKNKNLIHYENEEWTLQLP